MLYVTADAMRAILEATTIKCMSVEQHTVYITADTLRALNDTDPFQKRVQ